MAAKEQPSFPLLWTPGSMSWEEYGATLLAGQQSIIKRGEPEVQGVQHGFVYKANLTDPAAAAAAAGSQGK